MHTKVIRLLFLLVCFGCLFLCSCGLDDYYVIEPPVALREVSVETADPNELYYLFRVPGVSLAASSQISMKGTAVYYCLYKETSTLTSDMNRIKNANKEYSENGFNSMTSSSKYQMMNFTVGNEDYEYLSASVSPETYRIDLNDIPSGDSNQFNLMKATRGTDESVFQIYIPKPERGTWYLNAYAVCVGDVSLQTRHSQLAHLGVLKFTVQ